MIRVINSKDEGASQMFGEHIKFPPLSDVPLLLHRSVRDSKSEWQFLLVLLMGVAVSSLCIQTF